MKNTESFVKCASGINHPHPNVTMINRLAASERDLKKYERDKEV
jgi:hypothetical protein